ncbi:MAG: phage tail protein [Ruminococcus sp.]|nr:phage tail protein [Ruminococcus sp.]
MFQIFTGNTPIYSPAGIADEYAAINPKWTEELNKAGQLTFTLPTENSAYYAIQKLTVPVSIYHDGEEVFYGRVYSEDKDFYNQKAIVCEGALAFLNDVIIRPFEFTNSTADCVKAYIDYILGLYNAECGADWKKIYRGVVDVTESNNYLYRYKDTYNNALTVLQDHTTASTLGGYLSIRRDNGATYLDYTAQSGDQSEQYIEYGKNLLDITQRASAQDLYTVLIPLGQKTDDGYVTIKSVNDNKDYIESADGIAAFGRIVAVKQYEDITTPAALLTAGQADLAIGMTEKPSLSLSSVDMNNVGVDVSAFRCGDRIPVLSVPHGVSTYFVCSKTEIHLDDPSASTYELGATQAGLSDRQAGVVKSASNAYSTSESATAAAQAAAQAAGQASGAAIAAGQTASAAQQAVIALAARQLHGTETEEVEAESYADVVVTFSTEMQTVPVVMLTNMTDVDVTLVLYDVDESGFTARVYNNSQTDEDITFAWLAQS